MDEHLDAFAEDHINGGFGDVLDRLSAEQGEEFPDLDFDEPWDSVLERQEMEDHEQVNEYFGFFCDDHDW